jgi:hypothetical protein
MRLRLGLPLRDFDHDHKCACGRTFGEDEYLSHIFSCNKIVGFTTFHRHEVLLETIKKVLREHGLGVVPVTGRYHLDSGKRPDILVISRGQTLCVDLSVTHPLSSTFIAGASAEPGHSANRREHEKTRKHAQAAEQHAHTFSPWVFESLGRPGGDFLKSIAALSATVRRPEAFTKQMLSETAVSLQLANAEMLQNAICTT